MGVLHANESQEIVAYRARLSTGERLLIVPLVLWNTELPVTDKPASGSMWCFPGGRLLTTKELVRWANRNGIKLKPTKFMKREPLERYRSRVPAKNIQRGAAL